ncbi:XRE family transcriptional regulator [Pseudoflavonifractor sp. 524-17]|uniref:helix-turn-helix domain-containing protein n=1 Tax=Pseudoflavonifractor sp. 524-17 TaxID=2304577 RepID=UPI00137A5AC2|nr:helix-turn-helix transcriptional regulator [Pseudoflavonifractor sp. 524-17]NCE63795.1 XRE family transcriptional regulator [Pseudoflavonifractor sp. 524-17]
MSKLLSGKQFGENIRRIRKSRNLTQEETIARLQVLGSPLSRSTYSLIEMGRGNIYVSDLVALQMVFGAKYEEFFKNIPPSRDCVTHEP